MNSAQRDLANRRSTQRLVLKNTLYLVGAQILSTPLGFLVNAVMGRRLGPRG